jgi:flagellar biosynthesis/type III secretory pathway M-ring protein FliF/YscJ
MVLMGPTSNGSLVEATNIEGKQSAASSIIPISSSSLPEGTGVQEVRSDTVSISPIPNVTLPEETGIQEVRSDTVSISPIPNVALPEETNIREGQSATVSIRSLSNPLLPEGTNMRARQSASSTTSPISISLLSGATNLQTGESANSSLNPISNASFLIPAESWLSEVTYPQTGRFSSPLIGFLPILSLSEKASIQMEEPMIFPLALSVGIAVAVLLLLVVIVIFFIVRHHRAGRSSEANYEVEAELGEDHPHFWDDEPNWEIDGDDKLARGFDDGFKLSDSHQCEEGVG